MDPHSYTPVEVRHSTVIVQTRRLRDLFRARFFVRCWDCAIKDGPHDSRAVADLVARFRFGAGVKH